VTVQKPFKIFLQLGLRFAFAAVFLCGDKASAEISRETVSDSVSDTVSVRLRPLSGKISVTGQDLRIVAARTVSMSGLNRVQAVYGPLSSPASGAGWTVFDVVTGRKLANFSGATIELEGKSVRVDLRPAPDRIRLVAVRRNVKSELHLVGVLSLEDYVEGVVSAEVPRDWPLEALKAQAVAARSFTLAKLRERGLRQGSWQLESSIMDQVFEHARRHERAASAVEATKGQYLSAKENTVATTHYHSDCGGQTDEPRDVWGGGEMLGTASDMCPKRTGTNWRLVTSLSEITAKLQSEDLIQNSFRVAGLTIEKRSPAGRAQVVRLTGGNGKTVRLSGEKMRSAFGYMNLRSTLFEIKSAAASRIEFHGRGFGHGTGLCQWGARAMAQDAKTYQQIIAHYYPKLTLSYLER
jgi:stage II sporulation protein D